MSTSIYVHDQGVAADADPGIILRRAAPNAPRNASARSAPAPCWRRPVRFAKEAARPRTRSSPCCACARPLGRPGCAARSSERSTSRWPQRGDIRAQAERGNRARPDRRLQAAARATSPARSRVKGLAFGGSLARADRERSFGSVNDAESPCCARAMPSTWATSCGTSCLPGSGNVASSSRLDLRTSSSRCQGRSILRPLVERWNHDSFLRIDEETLRLLVIDLKTNKRGRIVRIRGPLRGSTSTSSRTTSGFSLLPRVPVQATQGRRCRRAPRRRRSRSTTASDRHRCARHPHADFDTWIAHRRSTARLACSTRRARRPTLAASAGFGPRADAGHDARLSWTRRSSSNSCPPYAGSSTSASTISASRGARKATEFDVRSSPRQHRARRSRRGGG